jgi:hypothetical protein
MIRLTITYQKHNERPIAKSFNLPEDFSLSISDIREKFVPAGHSLIWWSFDHIGLI